MALPAILGGLATGIGGSILPSIFGGGGGGGAVAVGANPVTPTLQFAAQMAAQNNPLTAAYQGLSSSPGCFSWCYRPRSYN
jgi:hypothetical protein